MDGLGLVLNLFKDLGTLTDVERDILEEDIREIGIERKPDTPSHAQVRRYIKNQFEDKDLWNVCIL